MWTYIRLCGHFLICIFKVWINELNPCICYFDNCGGSYKYSHISYKTIPGPITLNIPRDHIKVATSFLQTP